MDKNQETPEFSLGGSIAFDARKLFYKAAADEQCDQSTHTEHTERGRLGDDFIVDAKVVNRQPIHGSWLSICCA